LFRHNRLAFQKKGFTEEKALRPEAGSKKTKIGAKAKAG